MLKLRQDCLKAVCCFKYAWLFPFSCRKLANINDLYNQLHCSLIFSAKYVDTKLKAGNKVCVIWVFSHYRCMVWIHFNKFWILHLDKEGVGNSDKLYLYLLQEATEEELERLMDKIMVLFRFIHGNICVLFLSEMVRIRIQ